MSIPTHGPGCKTRTWPTKCYSCQRPVFFFSCNHGVRVLFDDLGPPWPVHDCHTSWARGLQRTTNSSGGVTVQLSPGVTLTRPAMDSFSIDDETVRKAYAVKTEGWKSPIVAVGPKEYESCEVSGILRELNRSADPFKTFNFPDTDMARAMLGEEWNSGVGKVTVHAPHESEDHQESYTTWIPAELINDVRIVRGVTVIMSLKRVEIPNWGYVWFCDGFQV